MRFFLNILKAVLRPFVQPLLGQIRLIVEEVVRAEVAPLQKKMLNVDEKITPAQLASKELAAVLAEINKVQNAVAVAKGEAEKAKEYAKASVYNQITLSMEDKEGLKLCLPNIYELPKKELQLAFVRLAKEKPMRLSLHPRDPAGKRTKNIFVSTIGQSGTHFIDSILNELGYQQVPFFSREHNYFTNPHTGINIALPLQVQEKMLLPGQYMMGHILGEYLQPFLGSNKLLLSIRDLRYKIVSFARVRYNIERIGVHKACKQEELTSENLITHLNNNPDLLDFAKSFLQIIDQVPILRFEELIADDPEKAWSSINALALVAECSPEEVFEARQKSFGSTTPRDTSGGYTYSGKFSSLDSIWTSEVEAAFVAIGGDVINEKFGYPKIYKPSKLV